ncbi:mucin-5AC-like [Anopheles maculipalpis]|uniref:mucin-5AC-like n=1 Tax=Anopheles maculipalpis TaxID=1496333 RepID=UPI0021593F58|nr:mucin-5AC-like [Anopheles maculipalpis]
MWKLLILAGCLVTSGLARPDVSHLLKKTGDKQKRQSLIGTSVSVTGNGAVATEIRTGDAANIEALIPQISLFPLPDNQPAPFRRLEERSGYDYQKPDFPLDVHPDSNLVSPVSTQAPEYLPPEDGEESSNVDKVAPPSSPSPTTTTTTTTSTTTTTTPAPSTTTTTTPAPSTYGISSTQQEFDNDDGYGYKKPEVMLPTNINEVIGEASDINQLATTTVPTTTTTAKNSLEYLPPKPLPELVVPKEPSTPSTTTRQPQTTTTYQVPTETQAPEYPKLPEASVYPDASATVSSVVTQQTSTELASTSAPEYLPPDGDANGFQIIIRSGFETDDSTTTGSTTGSSGSSSGTTILPVQSTEPTTTLAPAVPEADSLVQQEQDEQQTTEGQQTTTTANVVTGETTAPIDDASSVIALINQMQETGQVASQADFVPELRIDDEPSTTLGTSEATVTTTTVSSTVTTTVPSSLATTDLPAATEQTEPEQPEVRLGADEPTGPSLLDLLTPTTTGAAIVVTQNDTITTYRPSVSSSETTTVVAESSADETEIQSRIADPNDDGYNYEAPENGLPVPSSVAPSHTLEADGYHYKVPAVPFP